MLKLKDIFLSAGGLLALIGATWYGASRAIEARRAGRVGAAPAGGSPAGPAAGASTKDLTAQFVEAAEKAIDEIDRRSDELRLLLEKTEERLAAVRRPWPEPSGRGPFREILSGPFNETGARRDLLSPAALGGESVRGTPGDLRSDQEAALQGRFAVIYSLADQGYGLGDIATRVKLTKGEVQLILGLRKAR